jgi:hypothetical protein
MEANPRHVRVDRGARRLRRLNARGNSLQEFARGLKIRPRSVMNAALLREAISGHVLYK